jgi:predicted O-methyltransferase YrrM
MRSTKNTPEAAPKKLTKKQKDDIFAAHLPSLLHYHQTMLSDGLRNKLLYKAIKKRVKPGTHFLDIGAGTGVWAILAAKLGAERVVAVEIEEALIPILYKHAQENGVAQKIEIIHGHSDHVKLKGKFDVIVSELFGGDALGESTVKSFVSLRERFLAPGGTLIPNKLQMLAAPCRIKRSINSLPVGLDLSCKFIRSLKLNYSTAVGIAERPALELLAEPEVLTEINFRTVESAPPLNALNAQWTMNNVSKANAIVTFNRSVFDDGIEMDSLGSQSWGVMVCEFNPFEEKKGVLRFEQALDGKQGNWAISLPSNPSVQKQAYSAVFAFTRIRMAQQMTPHKKAKPPKKTDSKT